MNIELPDWYDELAEFECESKGCALNFNISVDGSKRIINFYDPARLSQDIEDEINENGYFKDEDAVVLPSVTKKYNKLFIFSFRRWKGLRKFP